MMRYGDLSVSCRHNANTSNDACHTSRFNRPATIYICICKRGTTIKRGDISGLDNKR